MQLYRNINGQCTKVQPIALKQEKMLPAVMKSNIYDMLDLHSLEPGFSPIGDPVHTMALDKAGAPILIMYKQYGENVVSRAIQHLKWIRKQNTQFFELLVQKKLGKEVANSININLNALRIICIADAYSALEIETVDVMRLKIELLLYREYEDNLFTLEPLRVGGNHSPVAASGVTAKDNAPLDALLARSSAEAVNLFTDIRQRILQLDDSIQEKVTRIYVAYRVKKNFAEIAFQTNQIRIKLRPIDYYDPEKMVRQVHGGYNWNDSYVYVNSFQNTEHALRLIEQSYRDIL